MLGLAIGAGVQTLGSLVGGLLTMGRQKKYQHSLDEEQNTLDKWYRQTQSRDYSQNENAKATLATLHRNNKKVTEQSNNTLIRNGATAESRVATAATLNEGYADAISNLSVMNRQQQEAEQDRYINLRQNIMQRRGNYVTAPGDYISAATQSIGGTISNLWGNDAFKLPRRANRQQN